MAAVTGCNGLVVRDSNSVVFLYFCIKMSIVVKIYFTYTNHLLKGLCYL